MGQIDIELFLALYFGHLSCVFSMRGLYVSRDT